MQISTGVRIEASISSASHWGVYSVSICNIHCCSVDTLLCAFSTRLIPELIPAEI